LLISLVLVSTEVLESFTSRVVLQVKRTEMAVASCSGVHHALASSGARAAFIHERAPTGFVST